MKDDREVAIALAFPGFNDLGRSVTPVFLLMDYFLHRFSTLSKQTKNSSLNKVHVCMYVNEEILSTRSFNFLQNAPSSSFFLATRLSVRRFQMPLVGLRFVKLLATFGFIYSTDPLLQNMTKIVCLR